jgi:hypothetical protein
MKSIIATTALALTLSAPAFAGSDVQAFFAQGNDSAAETQVRSVSTGDSDYVQAKLALGNASAAEIQVNSDRNEVSRSDISAAQAFFALGNASAAERIVR